MDRRLLRAAGTAAAAGLAWGLFEAQWVERRRVEVPVPALPPALDGVRLVHLSDFHLGTPSLNVRALGKALEWLDGIGEADLVVITGDLLSRRRGEPALHAALRRLRARYGVFAVLGNHDVAATRDPFSAAAAMGDLSADGVTLLRDVAASFELRGLRVQVAGLDPRAFLRGRSRPERLADAAADFRILLCHFPAVVDQLPSGAFALVLAGHLHGGQICVPYPGGKVHLAHPRVRYPEGVFQLGCATLVVSRGLGTTFVPFRFLARPEAAELVLRGSK